MIWKVTSDLSCLSKRYIFVYKICYVETQACDTLIDDVINIRIRFLFIYITTYVKWRFPYPNYLVSPPENFINFKNIFIKLTQFTYELLTIFTDAMKFIHNAVGSAIYVHQFQSYLQFKLPVLLRRKRREANKYFAPSPRNLGAWHRRKKSQKKWEIWCIHTRDDSEVKGISWVF